ncbi:MAG: hypothetical protein DRR19_00745 [Candidatus Parabeggiatoa sp. nov. 1]|nr:MAG: hypothetical protein DRR19_00745 [Gammaproteobacteria bacterium]
MKWLVSIGLVIFTHSALAETFKTLTFTDSEQFYKELEEQAFRQVSFDVVTDFTHPEQVPEKLNKLIKLDEHSDSLVDKDGSFMEGAKTTAILTLAGASLASAVSTGAVVGSAFMARGVVAGAAVGAAGGPVAPATIAIAAGVGAVLGFTIGVTVVVMSGDDHEMTFEIDPSGSFKFHVKPI